MSINYQFSKTIKTNVDMNIDFYHNSTLLKENPLIFLNKFKINEIISKRILEY
jgi:hypothetical protein